MTHKIQTQKQYYVLEDKIERSVSAQKSLAERFQCSNEPSSELSDAASSQSNRPTGRPTILDEQQEAELLTLFEREIKNKLVINKDLVGERVQTSKTLQGLDIKKIFNRIRYLSSLEPNPELPTASSDEDRTAKWVDDNSSDIIPPTVTSLLKGSSMGTRKYWSTEDEAIVERVYSHLFKRGSRLPRVHDIKHVMDTCKDEDFQMLMLSLGSNQPTIQYRLLAKCKTMHLSLNRKSRKGRVLI
ncbi:uncharacterized protein LOC125556685 [Nematostella vectensis]|uniref:uncharacterized protein LOC125556685 n=1 Tax=Nematostella vectensis TaxID=45351 RepID=UPI00207730D0|nr:uncharacterized protein LOC125556685 [Nematostella vectensis]